MSPDESACLLDVYEVLKLLLQTHTRLRQLPLPTTQIKHVHEQLYTLRLGGGVLRLRGFDFLFGGKFCNPRSTVPSDILFITPFVPFLA